MEAAGWLRCNPTKNVPGPFFGTAGEKARLAAFGPRLPRVASFRRSCPFARLRLWFASKGRFFHCFEAVAWHFFPFHSFFWTFSAIALPGLKVTTFFAGTSTASPVNGFLAW